MKVSSRFSSLVSSTFSSKPSSSTAKDAFKAKYSSCKFWSNVSSSLCRISDRWIPICLYTKFQATATVRHHRCHIRHRMILNILWSVKKSAHFFPFCSASSKFSRNLENIWKSNKNIWIKPHEVTIALLRHNCREEQFYSLVTIISLQPKISRQSNLSLFDQPTSSRPSWCLKLLRKW